MKAQQRGIALIILIPVIVLAMTLLFGLITFFFYSQKRAELQSALDISLLNAAQQICSTRECWNSSREIFLHSLRANLPGLDLSFVNLEELDNDGYQGVSWENDSTKISISRISWKNSEESEILEKDWQENNPGIPVHLINYGINVELETDLSIRNTLPFDLTLKVNGAVAAGSLRAPCVAPFAIKACSLLRDDGDYNKSAICDADRRFTSSNGYCRPGERCENSSEFDYDPLSENSFLGIYPDTLFPPLTVKYESPEDIGCFYPSPRYKGSTKDNNLIGLPGSSVIPNESLLQFVVSNVDGCIPAEIGQPFKVLHEGLNDSASAKIIWDQITNASIGGVTDKSHRPFNEITDRDELNINHNLFFHDLPTDPTGACLLISNRYPTFGIFNSFRSAFGFWDEFASRSKRLPTGELSCPWRDEKFSSTFWKTIVPVVADRFGAPCKGILESTEDPILSETSNLEIVGFARVHIYDVGTGGAEFPRNLSTDALECSRLKVERQHSRLPFGFIDQNQESVSKVQVRGRVACDESLIGGGVDTFPVLVR